MYLTGIEVEDITFRKGRKQSEIRKEFKSVENVENDKIGLPNSLTPEQLIKYYKDKAYESTNSKEKDIYCMTVMLLKELLLCRSKHLNRGNNENNLEDYDNGIEDKK